VETESERGRDLFELTTTGDIVTDITFAPHLQPGSSNARHDEADHFQRASSLADMGALVASIIVVVEPLESTLWENPEFASWHAHVNVCEAMAEARRTETSSHFGPDEVLMRAKELGFPEVGGSEGDDPAYRTAVFDAIVQERDLLRMLDVLDREREACRFEFDDDSDDEPVALDDEESARRWNQRRRELLAPQPVVRHQRRYVLPEPLSFWDPRNSVQQWYFVQSGADLHWWQGGSASSAQRENHGRWAHIFGAMSTQHGVDARTVVLRYDRRNVLRLVTDSPSFMVDGVDLVGNYATERQASDALLGRFAFDARGILRSSETL
jgi:hypothetical protein